MKALLHTKCGFVKGLNYRIDFFPKSKRTKFAWFNISFVNVKENMQFVYVQVLKLESDLEVYFDIYHGIMLFS